VGFETGAARSVLLYLSHVGGRVVGVGGSSAAGRPPRRSVTDHDLVIEPSGSEVGAYVADGSRSRSPESRGSACAAIDRV